LVLVASKEARKLGKTNCIAVGSNLDRLTENVEISWSRAFRLAPLNKGIEKYFWYTVISI